MNTQIILIVYLFYPHGRCRVLKLHRRKAPWTKQFLDPLKDLRDFSRRNVLYLDAGPSVSKTNKQSKLSILSKPICTFISILSNFFHMLMISVGKYVFQIPQTYCNRKST